MVSRPVHYRNPWLYSLIISLLYWGADKRIRQLVGHNKSVFEPACGFGRLQRFLHRTCLYEGIDLNEDFVNHAQRKGRLVRVGCIFDKRNYKQSDVVILSDILHHLKVEDIFRLVGHARAHALEKVVIVEPAFVSLAASKHWFSRLLARFFSYMDSDGFNHIESWFSKEEYTALFRRLQEEFAFSTLRVQKVSQHYFVELVA